MNLDIAAGEDLAITINTRPAKNAGLLVTMFTLHGGKTSCLAAGIRRGNARLCGTMEPINLITVRTSGHEPATLRDARVLEDFTELKTDWRNGALAMSMSDSVNRLTGHGDPQPHIFGLLLNALTQLCHQRQQAQPTAFQMMLLKETGLEPNLDRCTACEGPLNQATHYDYRRGGAICIKCPPPCTNGGHPIAQHDLEQLRQFASGKHPINCRRAAMIVEHSISWHSETPPSSQPMTRLHTP